jgi:ABC-2 type transport system permease protein/lipopolysaccharide transport system permease protein
MQVMFFITPVIWRADMLPDRVILLDLNPFYHIMETVRAPLLGGSATLENWLVVLFITLAGWALTVLVYSMYRWRIAYWV